MNEICVVGESTIQRKKKHVYEINKSAISILDKALRTHKELCVVHPTHPVCVGACTGEAYVYVYMYMECRSFLNVCV